GDRVWDDLDGSGTQNDGITGISGLDVTITGPSHPTGTTMQTGTDGAYDFVGLTPGTYTVAVAVPTGDVVTTPGGASRTITVGSGDDVDTVDVGLVTPASIGDLVFHDVDGDGAFGGADVGRGGVDVTITGTSPSASHPAGSTVTTWASGAYSFSGLLPGSYTVRVDSADLPVGTTSTTGGFTQTVTVASGDAVTTVDFGDALPTSLGDRLFDDTDGDGVDDGQADDPGIAGVDVTITGPGLPAGSTTVQTDADGVYGLDGLAPGTYTVTVDTADLPAGMVNTLGGTTQTVTLESGDSDLAVDFGWYVPAVIGDVVFADTNGNSTQNLGENGIAGVELTITGTTVGASHPTGTTVTTTASGGYSVTGLAPGTYTVELTDGVPADHSSTTGGDLQTVTVESGDTVMTVDFGLADFVTIGDRVWHDLDADGVQDTGESDGFDGVELELVDAGNTVVDTATTDVAGAYAFTNVRPGSYTVRVVGTTVPTGHVATTPESIGVTATSGADVLTADVGYRTTGSIGDLVWDDLDGDGLRDPGEPGIPGVVVTLGGDATSSTVTGVGGVYVFDALEPGDYSVTITVPSGAMVTTAGAGTQTVELLSGASVSTLDFGIAYGASIGDLVWSDVDASGSRDTGEDGLGGVVVELRDASNTIVATDTTDGSGAYSFTGLAPATYTVTIDDTTLPVGAVSGDRVQSTTADSYTLTLRSGDAVTTADVGYATTGEITGSVFEDDDASGALGLGEDGLALVDVQLLDASNAVIATVATAADGTYTFTDVEPGDYTVRVDRSTVPAGFSATTPGTLAVSIESDQRVTDVDFGEARPASIGDLVWHDLDDDGTRDTGEPGLSGIDVELVDASNTVVATATTAADGSYDIAGVAPGAYTVRVDPATLPVGTNSGVTFVAAGGVPTSVALTVASSDDVDTVDFAFRTTASIGDLVWHDLDADGTFDLGEPGLAGVDVELVDVTNTVVATVTT
ncbi:MAG: SdrD B-like domain-containing protein, partial [Actinomycetota bacterium]